MPLKTQLEYDEQHLIKDLSEQAKKRQKKKRMKVLKLKYSGESFGVDSLTDGKIYTAIVENQNYYRVIDDSDEDYLYSKTNPSPPDGSSPGGKWEIMSIEDGEFTLTNYEKCQ